MSIAWQPHKAAFGLWKLDHLECHMIGCSILSRSLTRVGLVYAHRFHRIACDFLDLFGQFRHLISVLRVVSSPRFGV